MALNVNRWLKYAKSRIDAAVRSGNDELDDLEARREAERTDKPWLSDHDSDSVSPSMDQVRARIEWEAERQGVDATRSGGVPDRPDSPPATEAPASDQGAASPADDAKPDGDGGDEPTTDSNEAAPTETGSTDAGAGGSEAEPSGSTPAPRSPEEQTADAEREMARLELEARQKASAQRLDDIRKELGVDPPPPDAPAE